MTYINIDGKGAVLFPEKPSNDNIYIPQLDTDGNAVWNIDTEKHKQVELNKRMQIMTTLYNEAPLKLQGLFFSGFLYVKALYEQGQTELAEQAIFDFYVPSDLSEEEKQEITRLKHDLICISKGVDYYD